MKHRELLNKYFNDTLSREEVLQLLTYLREEDSPANEALFREIWNSYDSREHFDVSESEALLARLKVRMDEDAETTLRTERRGYWLAAAVVSGLFVALVLVSYFTLSNDKEHFASGYGETRHIVLPDGSEVTLNANSSITYVDNWDDAGKADRPDFVREVWLDGEAFFSVKRKQVPQRFIVFADDVEVEVLGTTFNVNSRRDRTRVALKTGQVKLNVRNQSAETVVMKPGDIAEYVDGEMAIRTLTTAKEDQTSWLKNVLVFDDTPLHAISRNIEDIYGYAVQIPDAELRDVLFTGTVPLDDLDYFLKVLSRSCDVEVIRKDKVIIFQDHKTK